MQPTTTYNVHLEFANAHQREIRQARADSRRAAARPTDQPARPSAAPLPLRALRALRDRA